jgi:hypothetical protein
VRSEFQNTAKFHSYSSEQSGIWNVEVWSE